MKPRFKPNNVVGILIAVMLMVAGFVLSFINKQMSAEHTDGQTTVVATAPAKDATAAPEPEPSPAQQAKEE